MNTDIPGPAPGPAPGPMPLFVAPVALADGAEAAAGSGNAAVDLLWRGG